MLADQNEDDSSPPGGRSLPAIYSPRPTTLSRRHPPADLLADPVNRADFLMQVNRRPQRDREIARATIGEMILDAEMDAKKQEDNANSVRAISIPLGIAAVGGGLVAIATAPISLPIILLVGGGALSIGVGEVVARKLKGNAAETLNQAERLKQMAAAIRNAEPRRLTSRRKGVTR